MSRVSPSSDVLRRYRIRPAAGDLQGQSTPRLMARACSGSLRNECLRASYPFTGGPHHGTPSSSGGSPHGRNHHHRIRGVRTSTRCRYRRYHGISTAPADHAAHRSHRRMPREPLARARAASPMIAPTRTHDVAATSGINTKPREISAFAGKKSSHGQHGAVTICRAR